MGVWCCYAVFGAIVDAQIIGLLPLVRGHKSKGDKVVGTIKELCPACSCAEYNPASPMALTAGTKLDSYEVLGLLGAGGMGEVYRARDPVLKRLVAIKVLPSFVSQDSQRLHRFEQEAQAAAALNHPNILAVYHFGAFQGATYLVSELLEGDTLRQVLQHGPIPLRKAIDYGVQIAHGLAAAHEKGIIHRDL